MRPSNRHDRTLGRGDKAVEDAAKSRLPAFTGSETVRVRRGYIAAPRRPSILGAWVEPCRPRRLPPPGVRDVPDAGGCCVLRSPCPGWRSPRAAGRRGRCSTRRIPPGRRTGRTSGRRRARRLRRPARIRHRAPPVHPLSPEASIRPPANLRSGPAGARFNRGDGETGGQEMLGNPASVESLTKACPEPADTQRTRTEQPVPVRLPHPGGGRPARRRAAGWGCTANARTKPHRVTVHRSLESLV